MLTCPKCGTQLTEDTQKCTVCGADIIPNEVQSFQDPEVNILTITLDTALGSAEDAEKTADSVPDAQAKPFAKIHKKRLLINALLVLLNTGLLCVMILFIVLLMA